ncbi:MAG: sigma-54-dependent Fis family transcriptional regulator [Planctomycetes bacterium]|nr:sigma-54-dependent Fis family transcriptional regulator [Planctomycetota bacterium]
MNILEKVKILIVDDEPNVRNGLKEAIDVPEYDIDTVPDGESALRRLGRDKYDVVVTDLRMPGAVDGFDVLREARQRDPDTAVIVITAHGTLEGAVEAMKMGAQDFLPKPLDIKHFRVLIQKAVANLNIVLENRELRARLKLQQGGQVILATSAAMRRVLDALIQVAPSHATVLLQGESGTGKELAARVLHEHSPRKEKPFVTINCGALPETLFESEMFGHEAGAFTGASHSKKGVFEQADGGTLFLDEITEIPEKNQVDLLRAIQEGEIRKVGSDHPLKIDVRIIAATNRDAKALVAEGKFREDLYYRLSVIPIAMPPLRERREDIPPLTELFMKEFALAYGKRPKALTPSAVETLCSYYWPGNIRQLRNMIERLVITCPGDMIAAKDLPPEIRSTPRPPTLKLSDNLERVEREVIARALDEVDGHREKAAEILGISIRTLHYKLKQLKLT